MVINSVLLSQYFIKSYCRRGNKRGGGGRGGYHGQKPNSNHRNQFRDGHRNNVNEHKRGVGGRQFHKNNFKTNDDFKENQPDSAEKRVPNAPKEEPIKKNITEKNVENKENDQVHATKSYCLRAKTTVFETQNDQLEQVSEKTTDDDDEGLEFKLPQLPPSNPDVTICDILSKKKGNLLPTEKNFEDCSSPVAGGNLVSRVKNISDEMPHEKSPPSSTSTMSSLDLASRLKDFSKSRTDLALKPSGDSVENLEKYENLSSGKVPLVVAEYEFRSLDPEFMPISLSFGREYLFVTSQSTNQVDVFKNGTQQGVLKTSETKYFKSLHNVHTIIEQSFPFQVAVLDNEACHFFAENGLYIRSILQKEGHKYRGLGHMHYSGRLHLVTLDVKPQDGGVDIVLVDIQPDSPTMDSVVKRVKIKGTEDLPDDKLVCRFLAVKDAEVYVTSVKLSKIFRVDLLTGRVKTAIWPEPAGIAVEPKRGHLFVSSRTKKTVEVFDADLEYLGPFLNGENRAPIGLYVHQNSLYLANNEYKNMLKVQFKY